jgi:hypothetical protein
MKSIKVLIAGMLFFITTGVTAQVAVNVNLGTPPVWAPAAPVEVQYYYLPDIEVYYDVPAHRYVYLNNGVWIRSSNLPKRYRGYDLYHSRPVYLRGYKGNQPYVYYKQHKVKYKGNGKWNNGNKQKVVYSHGQSKKHGHGKGNSKGHGHKK